jgi:xylulokinase
VRRAAESGRLPRVSLLLGLDIGTSGARAVTVDEDGRLVAEASAPFELLRPRPGWSEQRPEDWWEGAKEVLARVAREAGGGVVGLGLTGQMHGSVFLDGADRVIRPALLWNDQRTARQADWIAERVGERRLLEIAGNPALTGFQAPKVRWLADAEPDSHARVASVLLPKDFVRLRLTGERATDASDASGTLFLDVRARDWSDELLDAMEVPREWLPEVREGTEAAGAVRDELASELGVPGGLPVAAGGGDNAAAAVGLGVVRRGLVSSSIGTSGVVFAHRDAFAPDPSGRVHAFCHAFPAAYHLMAVTLAAGDSLSWWRERVCAGESFDALLAEAADVPPGARGLVFLPYLSGERTPHRDPAARGAFVGLSGAHGRAEMTRAVLEGVAFSLRDGLDAMRELGVEAEQIRAVGGGARSALWRQIQADVYGRPVHRTLADEGPAYGAALLAGVAAGVWRDVHEATAVVALRDEVTEPSGEGVRVLGERYATYRELYPSLREAMHALASES